MQAEQAAAEVHCLQGDVRKPEHSAACVQQALERFQRLDILVNCAAGNFLVSLLPACPCMAQAAVKSLVFSEDKLVPPLPDTDQELVSGRFSADLQADELVVRSRREPQEERQLTKMHVALSATGHLPSWSTV